MKLKKYADRLDDYFERLTRGQAEKINASHIEKVIRKLNAKKQQLRDEVETTTKDAKRTRLERKILIANEHIKRAEMLLGEIDGTAKPDVEKDAASRDD